MGTANAFSLPASTISSIDPQGYGDNSYDTRRGMSMASVGMNGRHDSFESMTSTTRCSVVNSLSFNERPLQYEEETQPPAAGKGVHVE